MLKLVAAAFATALACLAVAAPAGAVSRFTTFRYAKVNVAMTEEGMKMGDKTTFAPQAAALTTTNDRDWQVTLSGCVLAIQPDETAFTLEDKGFRKGFESGFSRADNPSGYNLTLTAKATVTRQIAEQRDPAVVCNPAHLYWVALLRIPSHPGSVGVLVLDMDGYRLQDTAELVAVFDKGDFLNGQTSPAQSLGPVTAAIAEAVR